MPSPIDRVGAFRGNIVESGVGTTRNGFPQFTARLVPTQKWVDDKEEMAAFSLTEPGWVDWAEYDQQIVGYLTLFCNDKKNEGAMVPTFQFENLQNALGWDGASFASLGGTDWSSKLVTFWVEEHEWEGNVSLRVGTIDAGDAPPTRSLRALDANALKDLDSKFAGLMAGKKAAPAAAKAPASAAPAAGPKTPPKAPGKAPPGKAGGGQSAQSNPAASAPAPSAAPQTTATVPANAPTSSPSEKKGPPKVNKAAATVPAMSYAEGWDFVMANKGSATDDAVAEAWIDQSTKLANGKDENTMTPEEVGKVVQATLAAVKS